MFVPDGFTEQQVIDIINGILDVLSPQYKFGYYDIDDIRQEGFIFAIEVIKKYNKSRGSLVTFLWTHIKNRLINLKRDKLVRPYSPCSCNDCLNGNSNNCKRYQKWLVNNTAKKSLAETNELIDVEGIDDTISQLLRNELCSIIDCNLPVELRSDYRKIVEGQNLTRKRRTVILEEVKRILNENGGHYFFNNDET